VNDSAKLLDTAKSHGMDGSMVEPDWPPLTIAEVRDVLTKFPHAGKPTGILSISPRPFSAASVIETKEHRLFVKRHARSVRDREGLAEEHRFMAHLRSQGISVPRVLETDAGLTALQSTDWTYEVHEIPDGCDL
jgi:hypothetical protein